MSKIVSDEGHGLPSLAAAGSGDAAEASESALVARLDSNIQSTQPAAKPATVSTTKSNTPTTYAPDITEVSNDKDQLASLRGQGRYFGVEDPEEVPICSNCQRRGHIKRQCKVVICHACGMVDDHYESQCPKSMVCTNCGGKGHFRTNCKEPIKRLFCQECESKNHSNDRCPTIWRDYIVQPQADKCAFPMEMVYCYNCAQRGHYGDECTEWRVSKTPNLNGSAFSGENLPKKLIGQYYSNINKVGKKRSYNQSNYNFMPPPGYNNKKGAASGPSKSGFLPLRPQGHRNSGNVGNGNKRKYSSNNKGGAYSNFNKKRY